MANTYHQVYVQTIFAPKYREATIKKEWQHKLFAVTGKLINETGCKKLHCQWGEDHVHCFFDIETGMALSIAEPRT